jgi:hypothetical protein
MRTRDRPSVMAATLRVETPWRYIPSTASSTSPVIRLYRSKTSVRKVPSRSRGTRSWAILPAGVMRSGVVAVPLPAAAWGALTVTRSQVLGHLFFQHLLVRVSGAEHYDGLDPFPDARLISSLVNLLSSSRSIPPSMLNPQNTRHYLPPGAYCALRQKRMPSAKRAKSQVVKEFFSCLEEISGQKGIASSNYAIGS